MAYFYSEPLEVQGDIHFRLSDLEGKVFNFVVTSKVLEQACAARGRRKTDHDPIDAFKRYEDSIHRLAEKMLENGIRGDPILISNPQLLA